MLCIVRFKREAAAAGLAVCEAGWNLGVLDRGVRGLNASNLHQTPIQIFGISAFRFSYCLLVHTVSNPLQMPPDKPPAKPTPF